ncbi:MAG: ArsR family transcriptional regulator [Chloroflexi bacterium]|jgi:predicted ArsR family transcriptional regulator|nr:ArsR family transcriptional regulator [Chloroflexota bacterium]
METVRETSTRDLIMANLRHKGKCPVSELAEATAVSPISVRHHLAVLQAEGFVTAMAERRGVGRPRLLYSLTEAGLERFPTKYLALTNRLLSEIKGRLPQEIVEQLFRDMATTLVSEMTSQIQGLPIQQRVDRLLQLLSEQGFEARAEVDSQGDYRVTELNCPYYRISLRHPEVCTIDAAIISQALAASVQRQSCILTGDRACTFSVHLPAQAPSAAGPA